MNYDIPIITPRIAFSFIILIIIFRYIIYWWVNIRSYKYYILTSTFVNNVDNTINISPYSLKIKAKTKSEAMEVFKEATKHIEYTDKGKINCYVWDDMYYLIYNKKL